MRPMRPEEPVSEAHLVNSSTPSPEAHGTHAPELGECRLFNSLLAREADTRIEVRI